MILFIFKYCLPALLGYTLFVGIAGRMNPLSKPFYVEERPSWLLGICTGLSVSLVLGVGLHMAYGMSLEGARSLAIPSAWLMAALLLPGFVAYFWYRNHINSELQAPERSGFDWSLQADELESVLQLNNADFNDDPPMDTIELPEKDEPVIAAFFDSAEFQVIDTEDLPEAVNDTLAEDTSVESDSQDLDATVMDMTQFIDLSNTELTHLTETEPCSDIDTVADCPSISEDQQTQLSEVASLRKELEVENALRVETEKHMRIMRKALAEMESQTRDYESRKADSILALEDQLTQSITQRSDFERLATTEQSRRMALESKVVNLKQDLVQVKQDVRRCVAARAKALSTANKSIAFARQAVQTRARLESELAEARETLENRQATVSSLIQALEQEKRRTEDDVESMAQQYVLREKQMEARKSLQLVARSVEGNLTTRLVKKVAKARS